MCTPHAFVCRLAPMCRPLWAHSPSLFRTWTAPWPPRRALNWREEATHAIQATIDDEWTYGLLISHLEMLDCHWGNFEENHVAILQSDTPRDHPYFLEKDYGKTERTYTAARGRIYDVRARLHPAPQQHTHPRQPSRHSPTTDCDPFVQWAARGLEVLPRPVSVPYSRRLQPQ